MTAVLPELTDRLSPPWEVLESHRSSLVRLARARGCSPEDAQDLAAEALLRAAEFRALDSERAGAFLNTVLQRLVVDQHRRDARHRRALPKLAEDGSVASHEHAVCERFDAQVALRRLAEIPPTEREVLMARAEGHSVAAIAAALHLSPKTVEGAYTRARGRVRRMLLASGVTIGAALRPRWSKATPALAAVPAAMVLLLLPSAPLGAAPVVPEGPVSDSVAHVPVPARPVARAAQGEARMARPVARPLAARPISPTSPTRHGQRPPVVVAPHPSTYDRDETLVESVVRCVRSGLSLSQDTVGCSPS